ncbi:MAG: peptide chain release factor N(5)-glutamine methyltransferase, partial [Pseudomonadales bacterium]|nr:peptide chain release factor N(5)-glutamine methyltransferase [Pseudomonadales bacterium]
MTEDTVIDYRVADLLGEWKLLTGASDSPKLDCPLILAEILGRSRTWLLAHDDKAVNHAAVQAFRRNLARRAEGEPLAYITGRREFWSLDRKVTRDTLIPRPETELLVETAIAMLGPGPAVVADLGTGCGAIALALARERPAWQVIATDMDSRTLRVARDNADRLGLEDSMSFVLADWCKGLPDTAFDLLVSNPPYIDPDDHHVDDLRYEPRHALVAPKEGLADLDAIVAGARRCLKAGGLLLLEHGYNQQDRVHDLLLAAGFVDIR